ncbi:hypothetical protein [Tautonia plasticadhaerens]|uniref:DUF6788 domain-containing protein n=1 Tax=Tautonia plasticadhaerens TaxID=2527974 RepID=A0A518H991_9BACT|nr:hypothetical protein [Tautonia plasticadhaerens]QDV37428.1 hypothetical protein ElP_53670 [Tautonia plasticadhaerens]
MGWEFRGGSGPYYYRARKIGGKVVRQYIGRGLAGVLAERFDRQERDRRAAESGALRAEQARLESPERAMRALDDVTLLLEATLLAAGYYRHDRGRWRRRKHGR